MAQELSNKQKVEKLREIAAKYLKDIAAIKDEFSKKVDALVAEDNKKKSGKS
ncbi:MAG: hypothetical protein WCJ29_04515 [bacterium]